MCPISKLIFISAVLLVCLSRVGHPLFSITTNLIKRTLQMSIETGANLMCGTANEDFAWNYCTDEITAVNKLYDRR